MTGEYNFDIEKDAISIEPATGGGFVVSMDRAGMKRIIRAFTNAPDLADWLVSKYSKPQPKSATRPDDWAWQDSGLDDLGKMTRYEPGDRPALADSIEERQRAGRSVTPNEARKFREFLDAISENRAKRLKPQQQGEQR